MPLPNCRFLDLGKGTPLLLPHILKEELDKIAEANTELQQGPAYALLLTGQEVIVTQGVVAIALRPDIGVWKYVTVNPSDLKIETVTASKYLGLKENLSGQRKQAVDQLAHQFSMVKPLLHLHHEHYTQLLSLQLKLILAGVAH